MSNLHNILDAMQRRAEAALNDPCESTMLDSVHDVESLIATVRELAEALERIERGTEIPEGSSAAFMVGASIGSAANAIEIARAALASATKKLEELG